MDTYCIDITNADMNEVQNVMNTVQDEYMKYIEEVAEQLDVSMECANDVVYLRGRSRHTLELEQELIRLHREGNPPNIFDFGHTLM